MKVEIELSNAELDIINAALSDYRHEAKMRNSHNKGLSEWLASNVDNVQRKLRDYDIARCKARREALA